MNTHTAMRRFESWQDKEVDGGGAAWKWNRDHHITAQFQLLSTFESAWTHRKRCAFMRGRHYARDIICYCIATRQSSARHVVRICEPWLTSSALRRGVCVGRASLNSDRIYRALSRGQDVRSHKRRHVAANYSYVLRHLHQVLVRSMLNTRWARPCNALPTRFIRFSLEITALKCIPDVRLVARWTATIL